MMQYMLLNLAVAKGVITGRNQETEREEHLLPGMEPRGFYLRGYKILAELTSLRMSKSSCSHVHRATRASSLDSVQLVCPPTVW